MDTEGGETLKDEQTQKKARHRKKQLYNSILNQMEFYFSDSNLSKDRFLSQLINENPYIDLNVFLKFNKLRKLTTNVEDIRKAIKKSTLITLSEDGNSICRTEPIKQKSNVDECTIYVERLKSDATHDWVTSVFSEFGKVVYVSIPKYKHKNAIKGFAFVEFDTESEAQIALNYFENIGCKMPSTVEPEQLYSIATFKTNEGQEAKNMNSSKKRKFHDTDNTEEAGDQGTSEIKAPEMKKMKLENKEISDTDESENKKKKKLKKEQKKKNYIKELGLQVLSKKEWKKMRNRYLDLQRKKMSEFKKHLNKARFNQPTYDERSKKSTENGESKDEKDILPKLEFIEGVIVKMKVPPASNDLKKFKHELKSSCSEIRYVDIPNPGSEDVYVRFSNSTSAQNFCNQDSFGQKQLLDGGEENAYWDQILKNREQKFQKDKKKQRGRDKLLKKANKAKHIQFDE